VTVHKSKNQVTMYTTTQTLPGDPELPGFSAAVADFFL